MMDFSKIDFSKLPLYKGFEDLDQHRLGPPIDLEPERTINEAVESSKYINGAYEPNTVNRICEVAEKMGIKVVVFGKHYYWHQGIRRESANSNLKTVFISANNDLSDFWKLVREP